MRIRYIALLICIFHCFVFSQLSFSQTYPFRTYSIQDGLPQQTVFSILQDQKGYLWIGTAEGLSKFDGIRFITYTTEDGLAGNWIWSMLEDRKGNLWFGSEAAV